VKPATGRQWLALGLCAACPVWGQQEIRPQTPAGPVIARPYLTPVVPAPRMANSTRLGDLIRAGNLYLSAADAIALALENNIDLEVARYSPISAEWRLKRSEAGGALPGVTGGASQVGSVASGQGVLGSQSAAGVRSVSSQRGGGGSNASVSQVGPVTQTLDATFQESSTFSHVSSPQANTTQSLTNNLVSATRVHAGTLRQGFLSGGNVTVSNTNNFLRENSPTDVLNPSVANRLSVSVQHNLLQGFGVAVNSRTIRVNRIGIETSELNFKRQVITVVTRVLNAYYSLSADYLDLKAKRGAAEVAEQFVVNVQRQIEAGSAAGSDLITAQSQAVSARQSAVDSDTTLRKQEITLKNLLSRTGTADLRLAAARIIPVDRVAIPEKDELPPVAEMVRSAIANRPDLAVDRINERTSEISGLGTRNGLLPTLQVQASTSQAGLAGTPGAAAATAPDPYFVGGTGTALGQAFRRNFPTNTVGVFFHTQLGNNQAQADYAIDRLQMRQTQLTTRKDRAQLEVDVMNAVIALEQSRARYDAAVHNRILQEQLFASEEKKYELGASTPFAVTQQQRDLINAQSQELAAIVTYSAARVSLDETLGATLESNHVQIGEARSGKVGRVSNGNPENQRIHGDRVADVAAGSAVAYPKSR
jgi:outer membrane protein